MAWGDLFLASRQVIFGDKVPGTDELANSLWGSFMPTRFAWANLTKGRETRTVSMRCSRKRWWPSRERPQSSPASRGCTTTREMEHAALHVSGSLHCRNPSRPAQEAGEPC